MTMIIYHNISTNLERSEMKYWGREGGGGLKTSIFNYLTYRNLPGTCKMPCSSAWRIAGLVIWRKIHALFHDTTAHWLTHIFCPYVIAEDTCLIWPIQILLWTTVYFFFRFSFTLWLWKWFLPRVNNKGSCRFHFSSWMHIQCLY